MIQMQTILECADNSGAQQLRCIKVLGGTKRRYAYAGDIIVVSVIAISAKKTTGLSKVKKGDVQKALIIRTKKMLVRPDGSLIKFDNNAAVLIDNQYEPLGSRVFGPVDRRLRSGKFTKIVSLALEVL